MWIALLDAVGAQAWSHKQIVAWLAAHAELSGWWRQSVAVGYEQATGKRVPGETADAEFQVEVRVTVVAALATVWEALVSPAGNRSWLMRIVTRGKTTWMGLGSYEDVPQEWAEALVAKYMAVVQAGGDPVRLVMQTGEKPASP